MAVVSRSEWKLRLNEESKSENFRIIQERQLIISWQWRSPTLAESSPVIYSWPSETTRNWTNSCLVSPLPRVVTVFSQTSRPFCQKRHKKPSNKQVDCSVYTNNGQPPIFFKKSLNCCFINWPNYTAMNPNPPLLGLFFTKLRNIIVAVLNKLYKACKKIELIIKELKVKFSVRSSWGRG